MKVFKKKVLFRGTNCLLIQTVGGRQSVALAVRQLNKLRIADTEMEHTCFIDCDNPAVAAALSHRLAWTRQVVHLAAYDPETAAYVVVHSVGNLEIGQVIPISQLTDL